MSPFTLLSILLLSLTYFVSLNTGIPIINKVVKDDMVFPISKRSGIRDPTYRWPSRTIPYTIDPGFSSTEAEAIKSAMAEISSKTCIRFRQRTTESAYVTILPGGGCSSPVGKLPATYQPQWLSLGWGCREKGTIIHELVHAIGFEHEQERPDRDTYVDIYKQNIMRGMEFNFEKEDASRVDTFGIPYDYDSIMHYEKDAFSSNKQPTILPKAPNTNRVIGQRKGLSYYDVMKINKMYGC